MKKMLSLILIISILITIGAPVIVSGTETDSEEITLTEFFEISVSEVEKVTLNVGLNTETLIEDKSIISRFFEITDKIILTPTTKPHGIDMDGVYITVPGAKKVSVYITENGEVDFYSVFMSRTPMALYTAKNTSKVYELFNLLNPLMPVIDITPLSALFPDSSEWINFEIVNQPHSSWAFSSEEKDEMLTLFESVDIKQAVDVNEEDFVPLYKLTVFDNNSLQNVFISDIGLVVTQSPTEYKTELHGQITDYEYFKSIMDRYFTTQSTGYGRAMPGKQQTLEISDWAETYYEKARDYNLLPPYMVMGYMTDNITREQFCDIAVNLLADFPVDESIEKEFEDTVNPNVLSLADKGMILGKSDTKFAPNDYITREEAATILSRLAIVRMDGITTTDEYITFGDSDMISAWADNSIQTICKIGIMQGVGDNKFAPQEGYTIEQALTTAVRLYEYFADYAPKPGPYTYETPYGTITTEKDASSWVNFAIECDAMLSVVKEKMERVENTFMLDKPVKAFTDGMGSQYISFDTFADIFDGEWKLTDRVFEFTYDHTKEIALTDFVPVDNPEDAMWPNTTDAIDVLHFDEITTIKVNGVETELHGQYGGRITKSSIMMYNGQLYIHVQMVAELLGFDVGALNAIL